MAGLAGAGVVLLFNGLLTGHPGRSAGSASSLRTDTTQGPAPYTVAPAGANVQGSSVGVGPGVMSMIMSRMPGIVAVDTAGQGGSQQGTGLVLRPDGVILTTSQLVEGATTITVTSSDGQEWNADLLGTDSATGAAVISVPAKSMTVIPVDSDNDLKPGALSVVVSANSKSGGHFEASIGLFSGVNQKVNLGDGSAILDAIVTDAVPPNPMGAVLLDDQGRVVGILRTVINDGSASPQAVATPIALTQKAGASLLAGQQVVHAWLGVSGTTFAAATGRSGGALVAQVAPAGPAAVAGIHPGDVVTAIDNQLVPSIEALAQDVRSLQPGSSVMLTIDRAGSTLHLAAALDGQPGIGP